MPHPYIVVSTDLPQVAWSSIFGRPLCFVDIETNGTGADARIIEIALIRLADEGPDQMFATLLWAADPGASHLHDIWASDLQGAPRFADVVPVLRELVEGAIVVAHSAAFEARFLRREFEALGGSWGHPMLCTLKLARALYPERKGRGAHTQAGLAELHGLDWGEPSHHALPDTIQLIALVLEMARANLENERLEDAFTSAMIQAGDATEWPETPSTDWVPRSRASSELDSDDTGVALGGEKRVTPPGEKALVGLAGVAALAITAYALFSAFAS